MPFLRQSLYPLLDISRSGDTYTIKQKEGPFLHNAESELPENTEYNWQYPMVLRHTEVGGASGEKLLKAGAEVQVKSRSHILLKKMKVQKGLPCSQA